MNESKAKTALLMAALTADLVSADPHSSPDGLVCGPINHARHARPGAFSGQQKPLSKKQRAKLRAKGESY